ncbi:MAG: glycosyltransferase family 2 protein [Patescibacteria group bacterium]|jgi:hypothetical protein
MDLSIIIVNYKSLEKTRQCLRAVRASDFDGFSHEIIVVDNASGDNVDDLKKDFPHIKTVKAPENRGMGEGNNLGIKNAYGDFFLILNPDTYVEKNAIKALCQYMEDNPRTGIVGPKLLNSDLSLQYSCLRFPKIYLPVMRRTFLGKFFKSEQERFIMADFNHEEIREVDWMLGSALMIRRSMLKKIGPAFDGRFFMFFEDTDLCRRAKAAGFGVFYLPSALAVHDHARLSAKGRWYIAPFTNKLARAHIASWIKYFWKWKNL